VIAEVGSRLIDKFADNLAQQLASGTPAAEAGTAEATGTAASESAPVETASEAPAAPVAAPAAPAAEPATPAPAAADQEDSLNLLSLVGPVIAKRAAPVIGAVTGAVLITWIVRRVRRRKAS
jgi:predicted flap endonuclease-1-like 5' DNA nuclease